MTVSAGFEALCRTLDESKLAYRHPPDAPVLVIPFQRPTGRVEMYVQWHAGDVAEWSLEWPFLVPEDRRIPTMLAITALNVSLHVGRFDFALPNQRLVFRAFHVAGDQTMSAQQVGFFISTGLFAFDHLYLPLQDVCLREADPLTPTIELQRVLREQAEALTSAGR